MPSNDDIYLYKLSTKRVLNFTTLFVLLSTILNLRGQNVDKWQFSVIFYVDKILANPYISYYLPQHCLYFFPEPHAPFLSILSLYLVHIVLWLLALFYGHLVHIIISIICIINITNNLFNVDKMWTKSSYILSFVSKEIITYIDCLINVGKK